MGALDRTEFAIVRPDRLVSADESTRRVGVPVQELRLTQALERQVPTVVRPGAGRSVYLLQEVDLGAGRPDLVLLTISSTALATYRRSGLRITSPAAARVLDPAISLEHAGVTLSTARGMRRDLLAQGWRPNDVDRLATLVHDSLAIEAKMKDWKQALRQVSKFRRFFHRSAVLMPKRTVAPEFNSILDTYGCGLILEREQRLSWQRDAAFVSSPRWARLWLLELLLRGLEDGTAYRPTERRNNAKASR